MPAPELCVSLGAGDVIVVDRLTKSFGGVPALDGLSLSVPKGSVLGLLGPNGAGKSTLVRVLATLVRPDGGTASIYGYDIRRDHRRVRRLIGLTGQFAALDNRLSGVENLYMIGRLIGLGRLQARSRAAELLDSFDLSTAAKRLVRTYSGGMRRRLDLAASLVGRPPVLFLDEPTTGLDPRARRQVWESIGRLVEGGLTVLLTTQYLEEADALADEIVVMTRGTAIGRGTSTELKTRLGGEVMEVRPKERAQVGKALAILTQLVGGTASVRHDSQTITVSPAASSLVSAALAGLEQAEVGLSHLALRQPSLDEVFFSLTGDDYRALSTEAAA